MQHKWKCGVNINRRFSLLNEQGYSRCQLKHDVASAETKFRLSAKRTIPFQSAGMASVQSTAGNRGVRISSIMLDTPRSEIV